MLKDRNHNYELYVGRKYQKIEIIMSFHSSMECACEMVSLVQLKFKTYLDIGQLLVTKFF